MEQKKVFEVIIANIFPNLMVEADFSSETWEPEEQHFYNAERKKKKKTVNLEFYIQQQ